MKVNILKIRQDFKLPEKGSEFAGGWDLTAAVVEHIADDLVVIKLGFCLQPPSNHKVTIVPRSSITKTKWVLTNSPALIDPDYNGEVMLKFRCIPNNLMTRVLTGRAFEEFPYKVGDRCAQMYLEKIIPIEFVEVPYIESSKRGDGGFGSTGK